MEFAQRIGTMTNFQSRIAWRGWNRMISCPEICLGVLDIGPFELAWIMLNLP
jgi:hypothetical protein